MDNNAGTENTKQNENAKMIIVEELIVGTVLYDEIQSKENNNSPKQIRGIPISTLITQ